MRQLQRFLMQTLVYPLLRLLSIRNSELVCIDEMYIFVDPVEPVDADRSPSSSGNSAGNALMSLLVPTLLQLSRSQTMGNLAWMMARRRPPLYLTSEILKQHCQD
ncbi:hypothetical protein Droror1_Dr00023594 [Drosera rotundifolia]